MEGIELRGYAHVVGICTADALCELATPALLAVIDPVLSDKGWATPRWAPTSPARSRPVR